MKLLLYRASEEFDADKDDSDFRAIDWTPENGYGDAPRLGVSPRRGAG